MSPRLDAVIGLGFGDEGKGRTVDLLCRESAGGKVLVVRFNGGPQAGHTVETSDHRVVFHSLGAGTLAGAATYLAPGFHVEPVLLLRELHQLRELGLRPPAPLVDWRCPVITPWDCAINRALETRRAAPGGGGRHGSCGIGYGEAYERSRTGSGINVAEVVAGRDTTEAAEARVRNVWLPQRLKALKLEVADLPEWARGEAARRSRDLWLDAACELAREVTVVGAGALADGRWDRVVLEGAQGLCLDEQIGTELGLFPHLTRGRCGRAGFGGLLEENQLGPPAVHLVTRCYGTRHGAGPLPFEGRWNATWTDPTNGRNDWQEGLRHGVLSGTLLRDALFLERRDGAADGEYLHVTGLDTVEDRVIRMESAGVFRAVWRESVLDWLAEELTLAPATEGRGPRADQTRYATPPR